LEIKKTTQTILDNFLWKISTPTLSSKMVCA
jgi:hypothetical protein